MATPFIGQRTISAGALTRIFTAAEITENRDVPALNERARDAAGNEYIFLKGVASCVAGSWVTFDEVGVTALLAANAIDEVAIAQGAAVAGTYAWFQIYGSCQAKVSAGFADNGNLYATATPGEADDAVVAGDRIKCAKGRSAISGGLALVQIAYPFMDDGLAA